MERTNDLDTRSSGSPAATGSRASGRKAVTGIRPAGNERLQHPLGLRKTVSARRESEPMHPAFHMYESIRRYRKAVDGKNPVRPCYGEVVVSVVREQVLRDDTALRSERQTFGIGGLSMQ